jgi:large subunit ribosomal protein L25
LRTPHQVATRTATLAPLEAGVFQFQEQTMANFVTIEAEARERAGKGAARATRRQGRVPAVIYGAKQAPTLISLEPKLVLREIHKAGWRSRLYEVTVGGETNRALIREVQLHPVTDQPEHVDFQRLAPGEKIRVAVTVVFQNEAISPGLKRGGVLNVVRHTVECYVDPDNVPEHFEADLGELDINDNIRWSNLKGAEGIRATIGDRDFVIATVASPSKLPDAPAEAGAAAPAAAGKAPAKGSAPAKAAPAAKPAAKKK